MGETTAFSDKSSAWYLRSLADHDTHRGWLGGDGSVLALCGASFTPKPTLRVVGERPGRLVDGPPELALPPVPEQVCLACQREGDGRVSEQTQTTPGGPARGEGDGAR